MQVFAGQASRDAWPLSLTSRRNGIQVLAAAFLVLTQRGEGSTPSGPTRARLFDNSVRHLGTHDVAAACRLAMAGVWVRLPPATLPECRRCSIGRAPLS